MSGNHPYNGAPAANDAPLIGQKNMGQKAEDLIAYKAAIKKFNGDVQGYGDAAGHVTFVFYPDGSFNQHIAGAITPMMMAALSALVARMVQGNVQQLMASMEQMVAARNAELVKLRGKAPGH